MQQTTQHLNNERLVSTEEERIASLLKKENLPHTNSISNAVAFKDTFYSKYAKRFLDIGIALPAFIVVLPLNGLLAILTLIDVGTPILFKQTRIGKDEKPFIMIKFRNMNEKKDDQGVLLPASQRVTKFGKIVRKLSLDELLNFWSVLKGDMSIIGPRPLPVTFSERMSNRHKMRHLVKPGLECPRVIETNPDISQYHSQFENDIWYVENISFKTDIKMILLLIKMTLNYKNRTNAAQGASYFVGYDENGNATSFKHYLKEHPSIMDEIKA